MVGSGRTGSIKSALINSGFSYPYNKGITIHLAPATLRKEGAGFRPAHGAGNSGRDGGDAERGPVSAGGRAVARRLDPPGPAGRCRWRRARNQGIRNLVL